MKNKTFLITLILFISTFFSHAQDKISATLDDNRLYINVLNPSVEYELKLQETLTLALNMGLNIDAEYNSNIGWRSSVNPAVSAMVRNYYKRKRVKKELLNNSGNYLGFTTGYQFDKIAGNELSDNEVFFAGAVWGIQRNYTSRIHLGLHLGLGFVSSSNSDIRGSTLGGFSLGFILK